MSRLLLIPSRTRTHTRTHTLGEREYAYTVTYCYIFHYVNARFTHFFVCCLWCPPLTACPPCPFSLPPSPFRSLTLSLSLSHTRAHLHLVAGDLRALYKKYRCIHKYTCIDCVYMHTYMCTYVCIASVECVLVCFFVCLLQLFAVSTCFITF